MIDWKKPIVWLNGNGTEFDAEFIVCHADEYIVKRGKGYVAYNADGQYRNEGRVWIKNSPPKPVVHNYIVALVEYKDGIYPSALLNYDALNNHMVGHPGKVIATKQIEITEGEGHLRKPEAALSVNNAFNPQREYRGAY